MSTSKKTPFAVALIGLVAACSAEDAANPDTPEARGKALLTSTALSPSTTNRFACTTCHSLTGEADGRTYAGAPLAGAPLRPTFWAGNEDDLLRAVNHCLTGFMSSNAPLASTDARAGDVWAYLTSLSPTVPGAVTVTFQEEIVDVPAGDPARGGALFESACKECHGEVHTGNGRLYDRAPFLPDQTLVEHAYVDTPLRRRLLFTEKVRHGRFFNYAGSMPPFSTEALSDADLGALLAFFELY